MEINNNIMSCFISTSISSVVGNLTTVARDYVIGKFPKNYFKDVYVTTTLASSELRETDDDVKKKRLPILSIKPTYMPSSSDTLMESYPRWRRGGKSYMFRDTRSRYYPVFFDDINNLYIWAIPSRIKINFEIKVKVASGMQQMDLTHYLRQRMGSSGYSFLNDMRLDTEIPKTIIKSMAALGNVDVTNNDEVLEFLSYLKQYSNGSITKKTNLSSGNPMYHFQYGSNVMTHMESGAEGENEKISMTDKEGNVTFAFSLESWIPGQFILEAANEIPYNEEEYLFDDEQTFMNHTMNAKPERIRGKKVELVWEGYVTDVNTTVDSIDISGLFSDKQKQVITYLYENVLEIKDVFEVLAFRDNKELVRNVDYTFDWTTFELKTINAHQNYTHFVGIYGDMTLIKEYYDKIEE